MTALRQPNPHLDGCFGLYLDRRRWDRVDFPWFREQSGPKIGQDVPLTLAAKFAVKQPLGRPPGPDAALLELYSSGRFVTGAQASSLERIERTPHSKYGVPPRR